MSCSKDSEAEGEHKEISTGIPEVDKISRLLAKNPKDDQLYYQRAEAYYNAELYDLSAEDASRAIELDSSQWEYYHLLADAQLDGLQSKEALETLEKYISINPNRIPSLLKLSEFQFILKKYDEALRTIDIIVRQSPQEGEAYYMLGQIYSEMGDTVKSINSYQTSVEMNASNPDAWLSIGNLLTAQGNRQAFRYFDNGLSVTPGYIPLLTSKGYALQLFGQYEAAIDVFDQIISQSPQDPTAHYNKGVVYFKQANYEQADKSFFRAQKSDPSNYLFYLNRGFALEKLSRNEEALSEYENAKRLGGAKDERVLESIALIKSQLQ